MFAGHQMAILHFLMRWWNDRFVFVLRWRQLTIWLVPILSQIQPRQVLDLGSSCGTLAWKLSQKMPQTIFLGADTHLQDNPLIPVTHYDGRTLPFGDNSFDCVMLIDVLHHDDDIAAVLREAKRVSRRYLLIKEHFWHNRLDYWILSCQDYWGNRPYGIRLVYNFQQISDWHRLFSQAGLAIKLEEKHRYRVNLRKLEVIYLLEKNT